MRLFNIELTDEEYDYLMCEQAKGKELQVVESKDEENNPIKTIVAVEKVITPEELEFAKQQQYEELIVSKIRQKYNVNQELAILRQRDIKPQEFEEYNAFVEQCKAEVKKYLEGGANE